MIIEKTLKRGDLKKNKAGLANHQAVKLRIPSFLGKYWKNKLPCFLLQYILLVLLILGTLKPKGLGQAIDEETNRVVCI